MCFTRGKKKNIIYLLKNVDFTQITEQLRKHLGPIKFIGFNVYKLCNTYKDSILVGYAITVDNMVNPYYGDRLKCDRVYDDGDLPNEYSARAKFNVIARKANTI